MFRLPLAMLGEIMHRSEKRSGPVVSHADPLPI
jgi:hypothetical protein